MPSDALILFDDQRGRFGPMTRMRAAFDLRTGVWTHRERIESAVDKPAAMLQVRSSLEAVYSENESVALINPTPAEAFAEDATLLLVNGRWNLALSEDEVVGRLSGLELNQAISQRDGQLLAACVDPSQATTILERGHEGLVHELAIETLQTQPLIDRPWHILDGMETTIAGDLRRTEADTMIEPTASVHETVVLDQTRGPVRIDHHASVGPLAVLEGPAYIGPHSVVRPHAMIRPNTVLGPRCKVAGEISASILHSDTYKSHEGYLGAALLGRWINLGAQTNVSNLKNTYGQVRVHLPTDDEPKPHACASTTWADQPSPLPPVEETGRMFHGPIIGDYVRTAIGTRLPTGAVIDLGVMLAVSTFSPKYVKPMTFVTDAGEDPCVPEKFIQTARTLMSRRGGTLDKATESLLRSYAEAG